MPRTLGSLLHPVDREAVLNRYPYRMTVESVAQWPASSAIMWGGGFKFSLITDEQWLASTTFAVRKSDRRLDEREAYCRHNDSKYRVTLGG